MSFAAHAAATLIVLLWTLATSAQTVAPPPEGQTVVPPPEEETVAQAPEEETVAQAVEETVAQAPEQLRTFLGAKLGLNIASDYGGRVWGDVSPGPVLGGVASLTLGPHTAVQLELLLTRKGRSDPQTHFDYLEIPILVTLTSGGILWRPILQLGAAPSLLLRATKFVQDGPSRIDLGLVLGAGIERRTSRGRWQIEVRATSGLIDVARESLGDGEYLLNEVLSISAAYVHAV